MDWFLIGSCAVMAWVSLLVFAGERMRREQEREVRRRTAEAEKAQSPAAQMGGGEEPIVVR